MENTTNTKPMVKLSDIVAFQEQTKRSRTSEWTEYASKKSLKDAKVLTGEQFAEIDKVKGTFSFSVHSSNTWMVITLYSSKDKKYRFLAVNLATLDCVTMDSIKNAKKWVVEQLALVKEDEVKSEETVEEEQPTENPENTETSKEEVKEETKADETKTEEPTGKQNRRRNK